MHVGTLSNEVPYQIDVGFVVLGISFVLGPRTRMQEKRPTVLVLGVHVSLVLVVAVMCAL